jgi:hypothetical protein
MKWYDMAHLALTLALSVACTVFLVLWLAGVIEVRWRSDGAAGGPGKAARASGAVVLTVALLTAGGVYCATLMPSGVYPEVTFPRIAVVAAAPLPTPSPCRRSTPDRFLNVRRKD